MVWTYKQTNNDVKRSTNIVDVLKTSKLFFAAYCRSEINLLFFTVKFNPERRLLQKTYKRWFFC